MLEASSPVLSCELQLAIPRNSVRHNTHTFGIFLDAKSIVAPLSRWASYTTQQLVTRQLIQHRRLPRHTLGSLAGK